MQNWEPNFVEASVHHISEIMKVFPYRLVDGKLYTALLSDIDWIDMICSENIVSLDKLESTFVKEPYRHGWMPPKDF